MRQRGLDRFWESLFSLGRWAALNIITGALALAVLPLAPVNAQAPDKAVEEQKQREMAAEIAELDRKIAANNAKIEQNNAEIARSEHRKAKIDAVLKDLAAGKRRQ